MSDETDETTSEGPEAEPGAVPVPGPGEEGEIATDESVASLAEPEGGQSFAERYVTPLVLPVVVIGVLLFYVLNVSRVFLSSPGAGAVAMAAIITIGILGGAAALSAAPRMKTASIVMIVLGFLAVVLTAGSLTVGEAEQHAEEGSAALPKEGPAQAEVETHSANFSFTPNELPLPTGISRITLINDEGGHTFVIEDPSIAWEDLSVSGAGATDSGRVFIGDAGEYVFYCSIPGHREAGMEGKLVVEGDSVTLDEALAAAESGGGGGGGGTTASTEVPPEQGAGGVQATPEGADTEARNQGSAAEINSPTPESTPAQPEPGNAEDAPIVDENQ